MEDEGAGTDNEDAGAEGGGVDVGDERARCMAGIGEDSGLSTEEGLLEVPEARQDKGLDEAEGLKFLGVELRDRRERGVVRGHGRVQSQRTEGGRSKSWREKLSQAETTELEKGRDELEKKSGKDPGKS